MAKKKTKPLPCEVHEVKVTAAHKKRVAAAQAREAKKDADRSPKWPAARKKFLKTNKDCAACGSTVGLQVHHVAPYHLHPERELDPTNLVALCMSVGGLECHSKIGHGGHFQAYNPDVHAHCLQLRADPARLKEIQAAARAGRRKV